MIFAPNSHYLLFRLGYTIKQVIDSLTNDQWGQLQRELLDDPKYRAHQTQANLGLMLGKLGLSDGSPASGDVANELFERKHTPPTDKTFALSTFQLDWFTDLQEGK